MINIGDSISKTKSEIDDVILISGRSSSLNTGTTAAMNVINQIAAEYGKDGIFDIQPGAEARSNINALFSGPSWAQDGQSLVLDFINDRAWTPYVGIKDIDERVSFARATTGTYFDANGVMQWAANNIWRRDHDPVTKAPLGVLVEEQRTNLLIRSSEFDNAVWVKTQCTVTANAMTSPDGTSTMDKLIESTSVGTLHSFANTTAVLPINAPLTFSLFVKAAGRTKFGLLVFDNAATGNFLQADFDLDSGLVTLQAGVGNWSGTVGRLLDCGNGIYRASISGIPNTLGPPSGAANAQLRMRDAAGNYAYTGDGTSGMLLWGAQLEAGAFPTSYIPTVASAVTRAADALSVLAADWINATEGTIFARFRTPKAGWTGFPIIFSIDDGTYNNRLVGFLNGNSLNVACLVGSVAQASLVLGTIAADTEYALAFAYKANDFAAVMTGGTVQTDTSGTLPPALLASTFRVGGSHAGDKWNSSFSRGAYVPKRVSNQNLQDMVA